VHVHRASAVWLLWALFEPIGNSWHFIKSLELGGFERSDAAFYERITSYHRVDGVIGIAFDDKDAATRGLWTAEQDFACLDELCPVGVMGVEGIFESRTVGAIREVPIHKIEFHADSDPFEVHWSLPGKDTGSIIDGKCLHEKPLEG
jgi:hypothetical protein